MTKGVYKIIMIVFISLLAVIVVRRNFIMKNSETFFGDTNIIGDVDNNGTVGVNDYLLIKKHLLKMSTLTGEKLDKADVDGDGKIGISDYLAVKKIILYGGTGKISNNTISNSSTAKTVKVTGVTLDKTALTLGVNEYSDPLKVTITPSNATNQKVTWKSSDSSVVYVYQSGIVKGLKAGTATITATTADGSKIATCKVTVSIKVTGVTLDKTTLSVGKGEYSDPLTAKISPSNATNKTVTFTSSDSNIAYVYQSGIVRGVNAGTATITAKTADGGIIATCKVTVASSKIADKIHFLNTGSSNAFIIESNGHYALVDASNPYKDETAWSVNNVTTSVQHVENYLKSLGIKKFDAIIATHSHSDHIGGMRTIAKTYVNSNTTYYYRKYITTVEDSTTNFDNAGYYQRSLSAMQSSGAKTVDVTNNNNITFKLGDFNIKILNTQTARSNEKNSKGVIVRENKNSLAALVTYGSYKILLTGDMEYEDEIDVANAVGKVDILQMAHHGYDSATSIKYIGTLNPTYMVIPNAKNGKGGASEGFHLDRCATDSIRYAMRKGTKVYLTGNVADAIVVTCESGKCSMTNDGLLDLSSSVTGSGTNFWEKLTYNGVVRWLYYENNVPVKNVWKTINGKKYYFLNSGTMAIEWQQISGSWYYFGTDGPMKTGWQKIKYSGADHWFYFESDGKMVANTTKVINEKTYKFDSNGVMATGWQQIGAYWYYYDDDGNMKTGWQKLAWSGGTNWFYFESNGRAVVNTTKVIDGTSYKFDANGVCVSPGC